MNQASSVSKGSSHGNLIGALIASTARLSFGFPVFIFLSANGTMITGVTIVISAIVFAVSLRFWYGPAAGVDGKALGATILGQGRFLFGHELFLLLAQKRGSGEGSAREKMGRKSIHLVFASRGRVSAVGIAVTGAIGVFPFLS